MMHSEEDIDGIVKRVRRIARLAGCNALPDDDKLVYNALFTCLGMIATRMELNQRFNFHPTQQD